MTTFETTVEVVSIATTWAASLVPGSASTVTVAGCPSLILATSVSLKPAVTWSPETLVRTTKPVVDEPEPLPEPLAEELDEELETTVVPPPEVIAPTTPLTAVTVPVTGAVSVVWLSVSWAAVRFAWAWATDDSCWVTLACFAVWIPSCADEIVCLALETAWLALEIAWESLSAARLLAVLRVRDRGAVVGQASARRR